MRSLPSTPMVRVIEISCLSFSLWTHVECVRTTSSFLSEIEHRRRSRKHVLLTRLRCLRSTLPEKLVTVMLQKTDDFPAQAEVLRILYGCAARPRPRQGNFQIQAQPR